MLEWKLLTTSFTGWSLSEIREMSPRDRKNWLEIARELGRVVKTDGR